MNSQIMGGKKLHRKRGVDLYLLLEELKWHFISSADVTWLNKNQGIHKERESFAYASILGRAILTIG